MEDGPSPTAQLTPDDLQRYRNTLAALKAELAKVIVGQEDVIDQLLIALLCGGHALLVGVPGLAKTLLISTLAKTLGLSFNRIQFTPDLMPSDITGTEVIEEDRQSGQRKLRFVPGPVFANVILADEINRTPPKTQAALLEAMQEKQVTAGMTIHRLPSPFFVLATQNPIEQEGTYPLPEAQLDRFLLCIKVDYPSEAEEFEIVRRTTGISNAVINPVLTPQLLAELNNAVRQMPVADHVISYALKLARLTRKDGTAAVPEFVREFVGWGVGPRASQSLVLAAKAKAVLGKVAKENREFAELAGESGGTHVTEADVASVATPVLRHRLVCNFHAEAEGITPETIVRRLIGHVAASASPLSGNAARLIRAS